MTHLLRAKQSGIQTDYSESIDSTLFAPTLLNHYGINSQITKISYDPVQSLLAVGTASTRFGNGRIYVFGSGRIQVQFDLPRKHAGVKWMSFCADRLVVLDDKGDLLIFGLVEKKLQSSYSPPGSVISVACDPTLDFVVLGLQNGEIVAYDMDRENLASLRLPNFWAEQNPRARTLPVISLQFHPRDIGTLLVGYPEGAAIFSFKQNKALKFFHYEVPRGAPGGDSNPASLSIHRNPKLLHSAWHPTGQFVITGHDDGSMVFWDTKSGQKILARTLTDTNVDKEGAGATTFGGTNGTDQKTPLLKIVWCAHQDPDDTGILIAGGTSTLLPMKGLTFLELGRTPTYATSSWQILSEHFTEPKRQRVLPTPPSIDVVDFCLIPRKSPWFAGAHDPIAVVALLSSGEVTSLSFPSGYPISPTNQLPISVSMLHPFATMLAHSPVDRSRWLGMSENRQSGPKMLNGGTDAVPPSRHHEQRNIILSAHADGVVRAWDIGHEDEIENKSVSQADVARAVGRLDGVQITQLSLASTSGELAVGLRSGELVVFRWARNNNPGKEPPSATPNSTEGLTNVTSRVDPALVEGFQPFTLLDKRNGACTALQVSTVGFVAAGFEGGAIVVIDLRGPAIIFDASIQDLVDSSSKSSPLRRKSTPATSSHATSIQFSVMTLEGEAYSSILLHIGTNTGAVATLKILPGQGGRYTVAPAGATTVTGRVRLIHPLNASSMNPAYATPQAVASLRDGFKVDGALLVVTDNEARIFRPVAAKGAHNSFSSIVCLSAAVANYQGRGLALVGLFGDGTTRAFSIPGLKELAMSRLDGMLDVRRFQDAIVTSSGDIIGWTGPSEIAVLNVWGMPTPKNNLMLITPTALLPPRPTISNFEWLSGNQYIDSTQVSLLIGGPNRPPSKRALEQARADEIARRSAARPTVASSSGDPNAPEGEGYWAYMTRQMQERTEKLNIMGDSVDRLESNSSGWADDVNKFVGKQKKSLMMGAVKRGFGF